MSELADLIRTELAVGDDSYYASPENMRKAIVAVLDGHPPFKVHEDCGHEHHPDDNSKLPKGVTELLDGLLVCGEATTHIVCLQCCTWDFGRTDACASSHPHGECYPCKTIRAIAEKLDLLAEVNHDSTG